MFRKLSLVIFLLMSIGFTNAEVVKRDTKGPSSKEKEYHFRKVNWGMTINEVKKTEEDKPTREDEDTIWYSDKLFGLDVGVVYDFVDNQFFKGTYLIREEYRNKNNYIADYKKLRKALIEKYGKPILGDGSNDVDWKDPLYKDEPHRYGFAVSIGDLEYYTLWQKRINGKDTAIEIWLFGENGDITLRLQYRDMELFLIWQEQQKEKENSKL